MVAIYHLNFNFARKHRAIKEALAVAAGVCEKAV